MFIDLQWSRSIMGSFYILLGIGLTVLQIALCQDAETAEKIAIIKQKEANTHGINDLEGFDDTLLDGDMQIDDEAVLDKIIESYNQRDVRKKRAFYNFDIFPQHKWPETNGECKVEISYFIEENESNGFTPEQKTIIEEAMNIATQNSCLCFVEDTVNYNVYVQKGTGCISFVGKAEDAKLPQPVFLADSCFNEPYDIVHEFGHLIGLWHTHMRPDRNSYLDIHIDQVQPAERGNLNIIPETVADTCDTPFDYGSVMIYPPYQYAIGSDPIMTAKDPLYQQTIGQRSEVSYWDIRRINCAYCNEICTGDDLPDCKNSGHPDPNDCSRCICPDGWGGPLCNRLADSIGDCGGVLTASYDVQNIKSIQYGEGPYPDNLYCSWEIQSPYDDAEVKVWFDGDFSVFSKNGIAFHWVEIRYEEDLVKSGPRFSGDTTPSEWFSAASGKSILVVFKTKYDTSGIETPKTGFKLNYQIVGDEVVDNGSCSPNPCHNGGTCIESDNGFTCNCPDWVFGTYCNQTTNQCGGCEMDISPGRSTWPCESQTEFEQVESVCPYTETYVGTCHRYWGFWHYTCTKQRQVYKPCTETVKKTYCCDNTQKAFVGERATKVTVCAGTGWAEWGSCTQGNCGACGKRSRIQYGVVNPGTGVGKFQRIAKETEGCNTEPCTHCHWYDRYRGVTCKTPCCTGYIVVNGTCVESNDPQWSGVVVDSDSSDGRSRGSSSGSSRGSSSSRGGRGRSSRH